MILTTSVDPNVRLNSGMSLALSTESNWRRLTPDLFRTSLLFSNKSEEVIYLEIKVSHGCEPEKIKSGIRIIEIEVIGEDDIHRLGEGISLQDHNVKAYNLKQVKPKEKQCHKPCSVTGTAFAVFESGKTRVLTEPLNELLRVRSRRSTKFFKFLGANEYFAPWDYTPVYFENSVEAQFNEGVDVRSCLLCRKCGLGKFEKPIFCFEQGIETAINTAYNCRFFAPVATEEEARKRFERSLNYLERSGLQTGSAAALSGMDIDAELFEE